MDHIEKIRKQLSYRSNEPLRWLLGTELLRRASESDWHASVILQDLAVPELFTSRLVDLIDACRGLLIKPESLRLKVRAETSGLKGKSFDHYIYDLIGEIIAVVYLSRRGYSNFMFLERRDDCRTPDLKAYCGPTEAYIEVKNLRQPDSLVRAAFDYIAQQRERYPDDYHFDISFDYQPMNGYSSEQRKALEQVIDGLRGKTPPHTVAKNLPGGIPIKITIMDGAGVIFSYSSLVTPDPIDGGYLGPDATLWSEPKSLVLKVVDRVGDALHQLYSKAVPCEARRVICLRWLLPAESFPAAESTRNQVLQALRQFLNPFLPEIDIHIISPTDPLM